MSKKLFVVRYEGHFGFIKPWTAVRDEEVYSQQFLTPSMIAGIERKLFPELLNKSWGIYNVVGHRLNYKHVSRQQEQTQPRGWNTKGRGKKIEFHRPYAVINRGILVDPTLFLAFENKENALIAYNQHICLARNEDLLYPKELIETTEDEFEHDLETFYGFELVFEKRDNSFLVGYNRYDDFNEMYGWLKVIGDPVKSVF